MTTIQVTANTAELNKRGRVFSNSPPMSSKKQKEVDNCVTCGEPTVEDPLECVWCERWEHSKCVKISNGQCSVLSNIPSNVVFFCSQCLFKLPEALKAFDKSNATCSFVEDKLKSVEVTLSNKFASLTDQLNELSTKISQSLHENDKGMVTDNSPPEQINQSLRSPPSLDEITASFSSMMSEQKEKESRKLNLIMHNMVESNDPIAANRKKHDIDSATDILQRYVGITATIKNAFRIGKKLTDKSRLLKITLSSEDEKVKILRSCTKLRDKDYPEEVRKIFITPDQTPQEQKRNKELRTRLATLNATSNDYRIKNGKIVRRNS